MGQELRDSDGRVVGHFLTPEEYRRLMYDLAEAEFARRDAEDRANGIVRKWDGTNGMTTVEAIRHLEEQGRRAKEG